MNASDDGFDWVTVSEASRRLNLSPSEVRRRIRVGTLRGERHQRGPGDTRDRFMVQLPAEAQTTPSDAPTDAQPRADSEVVLRLIDALERQGETIARLSERTSRAETGRYNASARADKAEARAAKAEADLEAARRPWWRRLLGR